MEKIVFGCDHVDFILKHEIVAHLVEHDVEVIDKGIRLLGHTDCLHYTGQVALAVAGGEADGGILICGTGVDISITAGEFAGIRTVVCNEPYSVQLPRQHNDTNTLAFGSWVAGLGLAKMIVDAQLGTQYEDGRHQ